jgi:oxalate decarboxylase
MMIPHFGDRTMNRRAFIGAGSGTLLALAAMRAVFNAGDVGYVQRTFGHYIENTGNEDLIFLEMFKAPRFEDLSLAQWVSHIPPQLLKDHIGISKEDVLSKVPDAKQGLVPFPS